MVLKYYIIQYMINCAGENDFIKVMVHFDPGNLQLFFVPIVPSITVGSLKYKIMQQSEGNMCTILFTSIILRYVALYGIGLWIFLSHFIFKNIMGLGDWLILSVPQKNQVLIYNGQVIDGNHKTLDSCKVNLRDQINCIKSNNSRCNIVALVFF